MQRDIVYFLPSSTMTTKRTPPANKAFCVWADYVRRVYQHVDARNPRQAHAIAKRQSGCWEPCDLCDTRTYRLSNEVQDLATEEFTSVRDPKCCRTCGSEIVESINGSNFHDGECGSCEYQGYRACGELIEALDELLAQTLDQDLAVGNELSDREEDARQRATSAIARAHGHA